MRVGLLAAASKCLYPAEQEKSLLAKRIQTEL